MLYVVPIEPLEERYSEQWLKWTQHYFSQNKQTPHKLIVPRTNGYQRIKNGAFLDVVGTNLYKSRQMSVILKLFEDGKVRDGDIFWFHDLWFPGLESLFYIRDALGINFKIFGCLHAGTYDPHDFLTRKGMGSWGMPLERAWFNEVDGIFVATKFHKKLLIDSGRINVWNEWWGDNVRVTGFPFYSMDIRGESTLGWDYSIKWLIDPYNVHIVFPHRLDPEKQPEKFDELEAVLRQDPRCKNWKFTKTKEVCTNKESYYKLLRNADVAVSFALQETWGIAMQEALVCGAVPVVPNRLSYTEMYGVPDGLRDNFTNISVLFDGTVQGAAERIKHIVFENYEAYCHLCSALDERISDSGFYAFPKMLYYMLLAASEAKRNES